MKRVLITPLDWGLGHATRCIPVIRELESQGCEVMVAGSGDSLKVLKIEFPSLGYFSLPGYDPTYPSKGSMVFKMIRQIPHFMEVISAEHHAIEKIAREQMIDFIISDNRYGCWSKCKPSVFITHQSNILMPQRFGIFQGIVRILIRRLIDRFNVCWIPDFPAGHSLAGDLISFGKSGLKAKVRYIGWLSRFQNRGQADSRKYQLLAVFSGPEPQRTMLEQRIVPQLRASGLRYKIVRGLPSASGPDNDQIVNFVGSEALQHLIESSEVIVARSGYSSVMDLNALGSKAIFVPTPGQTEQEYLAQRLMDKGIAYSIPQEEFDLAKALNESKNYRGFKPSKKNTLLAEAIRELLQTK